MDSKPASFRVLLGLIILIVVVVLAVAYLPFLSGVKSWWGVVTAPSEVRNTAYIGTEDGVGVAYTAGFLGLSKHSFEGYSVVDYAKNGKLHAAILREGDSYDVYDVSNGTPVKLTEDGVEKSTLAISPNGTVIAYGQKNRTLPLPVGATKDDVVYNLSEWDINVYDVTAGEGHLVGPGNHPRFYADGLFYPNPYGFMYRTPGDDGYNQTDHGGVVADVSAYRVFGVSDMSEDGRYAFRNPLVPSFDVLWVESLNPLSVVAAPENPISVPEGTYSLILGKGSYFVLAPSASGAGVFRLTDDSPTTLFMLPAAFMPDHLTRTR